MIAAYLSDAEAAIMVRIPDAVSRSAVDALFRDSLVGVESAIALRAAPIPARIDMVPPGAGNVQDYPDAAPGFISVRREEWRRLGVPLISSLKITPNPDYAAEEWVSWRESPQ